jgi:hypothetical protein
MRALLAFLVLSNPALAGEAVLPGEGAFRCQLEIKRDFIAPYALVAKDQVTDKVLFAVKKGDTIQEDRCINAPERHSLVVSGEGVSPYEAPPKTNHTVRVGK